VLDKQVVHYDSEAGEIVAIGLSTYEYSTAKETQYSHAFPAFEVSK